MNMNQLLDQLYESDADDVGIEKTAEQAFMGAIDTGHAPNPYEDMSLEELMKLAGEMSDRPPADPAVKISSATQDELHKTAAAQFGAEVMAHSMIHELQLVKIAVANGVCRVCKENHMDIEGSSICGACLHEEA
jgi:hypothetical protein